MTDLYRGRQVQIGHLERRVAVYVKVCGLRTAADVEAAVEAGADAVGFVFTDSVRRVSPGAARRLAADVPDGVLTVGVFRGEPVDVVREAVAASRVRAVQLHGDEPRTHYDALRDLGLELVRATSMTGPHGLSCGELGEDLLIVDSPVPGSGAPWSWQDLTPGTVAGRWLLAGGLHPDNVVAAIEAVRPWGVDVSSGVESRRGVKDPALIARFVRTAKSAG